MKRTRKVPPRNPTIPTPFPCFRLIDNVDTVYIVHTVYAVYAVYLVVVVFWDVRVILYKYYSEFQCILGVRAGYSVESHI